MTHPTLIILRGLPGAGKSSWIRERFLNVTPFGLAPENFDGPVTVSADHYFTDLNGNYRFDVTKLGPAHAAAQCNLVKALKAGKTLVIVDNTHTTKWEYALAYELGRAFGYDTNVVSLFDGGCTDVELFERNTHGVPLETIQAMRDRWEE
jgi:predicted kinase